MKRNIDLTYGNMKRHIIRLAIPLILGNILQQTYNTIDAFVIGRYASELEFSSVGVASSIMNLMIFIWSVHCIWELLELHGQPFFHRQSPLYFLF